MVWARGGRHREAKPGGLVVVAGRHRLELRAVGGQEKDVDAVEADDVARGADERHKAVVALPGALHGDGGVGEPLEQRAPVLRLPEQPRFLDRERGLVGQRREQRDLVRQEVARPFGEDVERSDGAPVGAERDADKTSEAPLEGATLVGGIVTRVLGQILDHDRLTAGNDEAAQALPDLEPRPRHHAGRRFGPGADDQIVAFQQAEARRLGGDEPGGLVDDDRQHLLRIVDRGQPA